MKRLHYVVTKTLYQKDKQDKVIFKSRPIYDVREVMNILNENEHVRLEADSFENGYVVLEVVGKMVVKL